MRSLSLSLSLSLEREREREKADMVNTHDRQADTAMTDKRDGDVLKPKLIPYNNCDQAY